jgi:hypothetical protein
MTEDVLSRIASDIGPITTGRISSPDGERFMDFDTMTCDPETYKVLELQGMAFGWRIDS